MIARGCRASTSRLTASASLGSSIFWWVQALGLSLLTSAAALAVALAREGALPISLLGASAFALAPAGVGVLFGQWLRKRTHPAVFVRVFAVGLLLIGLDLALRNLT
jgi:uncharacterized protein